MGNPALTFSPRWRVAIVDDHEPSRADVRAAVMAAGGEVAGEATRGTEAAAVISRARPDVVICAVGLPDGDGIAAAAEMTAGVPVVLFTSHTRDELVARAQSAGVMAYLLKPLRPAELAPPSERFTERPRRRRAVQDPDFDARLRETLEVFRDRHVTTSSAGSRSDGRLQVNVLQIRRRDPQRDTRARHGTDHFVVMRTIRDELDRGFARLGFRNARQPSHHARGYQDRSGES